MPKTEQKPMSTAARKKSLTHYSNADFLQKRRLSGYSSQGKGRKKSSSRENQCKSEKKGTNNSVADSRSKQQ